LYLPRSWTQNSDRRHEAGVPDAIDDRSKTDLAIDMGERALTARVPATWAVADALDGSDSTLRRWLACRSQRLFSLSGGRCSSGTSTPCARSRWPSE
jgi:SRSO17 transposase